MRTLFLSLIPKASEIILGKEDELKLSLTCILAGGHLLVEDVPGVGKTTLVQVLAQLLGLEVKRVQCTVDLLPADILGSQVYHPHDHRFEFHPGPIFSQLLMIDELNRASPRTQSALLQAMEEGQVSIDGTSRSLPKPFYVIATQNPHEQLGTFPLPESQLDRFLMSLELQYASATTEKMLFRSPDPRRQIDNLQPLLSSTDILTAQMEVENTLVSEAVAEYVSRILETSRREARFGTPLSTRAGLALIRGAKAWAYLDHRDYLRPEDIQAVMVSVLSHRLGGHQGRKAGRQWAKELKDDTEVPR